MRILRATDYKVMPWKNNLGFTTEIAVSPRREELTDFDWRVSMAQVENNNAFSRFSGIDRVLLVLAGNGMALDVAGRDPVTLTRDSPPYAFPGDAATSATLIDGPIIDLNIMARRDLVRAHVERIKLVTPQCFPATGTRLLFVETGAIAVRSDAVIATLTVNDTLYLDPDSLSPTIAPVEGTVLISIQFKYDDTTDALISMTP